MTTSDLRRITVDLEPEGPPIQGSLQSGPEPSHRFTGWIGLLSALEKAIQGFTSPSAVAADEAQGDAPGVAPTETEPPR
jgi:hypothetical protein